MHTKTEYDTNRMRGARKIRLCIGDWCHVRVRAGVQHVVQQCPVEGRALCPMRWPCPAASRRAHRSVKVRSYSKVKYTDFLLVHKVYTPSRSLSDPL